jgi:polyphosphate kinase
MQRNLDNRVEVYTPVYDPELQMELKTVIEFGLKDNIKARIVDGSGNNLLNVTSNKTAFRSQEELYQFYKNKYNMSLSDKIQNKI